VNLLGDNIDTIKKNTETLTDATEEVCLEINIETTKYVASCHWNVGQNHIVKTANRSSEIVAQSKYLRRTVTNQNLICKQ
jgi:hypothetical protein